MQLLQRFGIPCPKTDLRKRAQRLPGKALAQLLAMTLAAAVVAGLVASIIAAFVPMKLLLIGMERNLPAPIRHFIERQRDRRRGMRPTPDRRGAN